VTRSRSEAALQQREEGFAEVMRDEPGIAVLDTLEHGGDAEAARDTALRAIMQYQGLSAFYATEPASALGCAEAVAHMAHQGEVKIACVGGTSDIMRRVDDGSIIAAVAPRHYMAGKQAVNLLWTIITKGEARALERLPEDGVSNVGGDLVTARDLHSRRVEFRRLGLAVDF
jgi:ABC-type sugar transport system substrate-binding protein